MIDFSENELNRTVVADDFPIAHFRVDGEALARTLREGDLL